MAWRLPDYEPMNLLGSGPTGSVVLSRDRTTGTLVAIKYLSKSVYQAPGFADLYRFEAARLVHVDNPHLALLYEYVEGTESAAVVSEYIDGVSLRALLDGGGALDPQPALYVIKSILDGLSEPHRKGIAHSDLRPENVLVDKEGVPKVVDMGIAAPLTRRAPAAGDPRYRAPEMWMGEAATGASDAYAVTVTLFECLTGETPKTASGEPLGLMVLDPEAGPAESAPAAAEPVTAVTAAVASAEQTDGRTAPTQNGAGPSHDAAAPTDAAASMANAAAPTDSAAAPTDSAAAPTQNAAATTRTVATPTHGADQIAAILPANLAPQIRAFMIKGLSLAAEDRAANAAAMIEELDAAALAAYGPAWEKAGKAKLAYRVAALRTSRRAAALAPVDPDEPAARTPWTRTLIAVGFAVVLLLFGVAWASGLFSGNAPANAQGAVPVYTHTPDSSPGPTVPPVPNPAATGAGRDTIKPELPTGLHVIGRSQTGLEIDWNPTRDNIRVIGYIVLRDGHQIGTTYLPGYADTGLRPSTQYSYNVVAFDAAGNRSPVSATAVGLTLTEPDRSPPTVPTGLHSPGSSETTIVLSWAPSHDNVGVAGYDVFRDGRRIASVIHPGFTDTRLAPGSAHKYSVRAYDTSNNESGNSSSITVITLSAPDKTPPSTPGTFTATVPAGDAGASTINLTWTASTGGATKYEVFRDGSWAATVTGTSFADYNLKADTTYSYTLYAYDASGNRSKKPATAKAKTAVQTTPPPPTPTVTGLTLTETSIGSDCKTTVTAAVGMDNGPQTVLVDFWINGSATADGATVSAPGSVALATITVTADGHLDATVDGTSFSKSIAWSVPADCVPSQDPTTPPATGPTTPPPGGPTTPPPAGPTTPPPAGPTTPPPGGPTTPPPGGPTTPPPDTGGPSGDASAPSD